MNSFIFCKKIYITKQTFYQVKLYFEEYLRLQYFENKFEHP